MVSIAHSTISSKATIFEALKVIDSSSLQIAFVIEKEKLKGVVTDGDIRRGLLKGMSVDDSIREIYNAKPISCHESTSENELKYLAIKHDIKQLPLVDDDGKLVGITLISELLSSQVCENVVILMAGGLGTRLGELTKNTPKPLLKVAKKPILYTIIENFVKYGFNNFIISVNYKSDQIKSYFKDGKDIGINIQYLDEDKRMGTAGSLSLLSKIPQKPFFVMNADILTSIDFKNMLSFHNRHNSMATMGIREYENQIPFGVVNTDGNTITSIVEKPIQQVAVSAGVYILDPKSLSVIPKNKFFDMPTLFDALIQSQKKVVAYAITDYWIDIGHINEYEKANKEYSRVFDV